MLVLWNVSRRSRQSLNILNHWNLKSSGHECLGSCDSSDVKVMNLASRQGRVSCRGTTASRWTWYVKLTIYHPPTVWHSLTLRITDCQMKVVFHPPIWRVKLFSWGIVRCILKKAALEFGIEPWSQNESDNLNGFCYQGSWEDSATMACCCHMMI